MGAFPKTCPPLMTRRFFGWHNFFFLRVNTSIVVEEERQATNEMKSPPV